MLELKRPDSAFYGAAGLSLVLFMLLFGFQVTHIGGHSSAGNAESPGGSAISQAVYLCGFLLAICAVNPVRDLGRLLLLPISMTLAFAWFWSSLAWSIAPSFGLRRLIMVSIFAWTIFACVRSLGYVRSLTILRLFFAAAIASSLMMVIIFPDLAKQVTYAAMIDGEKGWRGILIDKNSLGSLAAISTLVFVAEERVGSRAYRWSFATLSFICLVGSQSKTALGVTIAAIPVAYALSRFPARAKALLIPAGMIVGVGIFLIRDELIRPFSEARYDPDAFTGRGQIWNALWPYFESNPYFGTGFGSFWWVGYESPIFTYARSEWVEKIAQGHNGYLDLFVTVGIPGMLLAVVAVFIAPVIRMFASDDLPPNLKFIVFSILIYVFGNNFTESTLFNRDMIPNVMAFFAVALLSIRPGDRVVAARASPQRPDLKWRAPLASRAPPNVENLDDDASGEQCSEIKAAPANFR